MNCSACSNKLNASQWSADQQWKSCPRCSQANGKEHVFYAYPANFGETEARASASHPNGPQSYCVECRADHTPTFAGAKLCHQV